MIPRIGLLALLCLISTACDFGKEQRIAYERVQQEKSVVACQDYLKKWPDGEFSQDIKKLLAEYKKRDLNEQLDLYLAFGRSPRLSTAQEYLERFPQGRYREYFVQAVEQHSEAINALTNLTNAQRYLTERPPGPWTSYVRDEIFSLNLIQEYPLHEAIDSKNWLALDFYMDRTESEKRVAEIKNMIQEKIEVYENSRKPIEISANQKTVTIPRGGHAQGKGWRGPTIGNFTSVDVEIVGIDLPKSVSLSIIDTNSKSSSRGVYTEYVYGIDVHHQAPLGPHEIRGTIHIEYSPSWSSTTKKEILKSKLNLKLNIKKGSVSLDDIYCCYLLAKMKWRQMKVAQEEFRQMLKGKGSEKFVDTTNESYASMSKFAGQFSKWAEEMGNNKNKAEKLKNASALWAQRLNTFTESEEPLISQTAGFYMEAFRRSRYQ